MKQKIIIGLIMLTALCLLTACGPTQVHLDGKTMGTWYSIKYLSHASIPAEETVKKEIDNRLALINSQMSGWQPHSELSRFNQSREINSSFPVSVATTQVVQEALRIHQLTGGALDITLGPVINLWGFGPQGRAKVPEHDILAMHLAWTGMDNLQVSGHALSKRIPELYLDLSAIAKGYAVDVIAEYLQSQNVHDFIINIGGEVRTRGHNARHQPWRVAIEMPNSGITQKAQRIIMPGNMSLATSGDYRNYFEENGVRYSHTLDPKTGRPVSHQLVSITVLHPSCMTADGFATALNVLGPDKGMQLADRLNLPVLMLVQTSRGLEERHSYAFKPYLATE